MSNNPQEEQSQDTGKNGESQIWLCDHKFNSKEIIELIDREIYSEHNLISNRMTWYVTSQSFLMAAFAISGGHGHTFKWLSKPFIPILGIVTSFVIWCSLIAAVQAMNMLKNYKKDIFDLDTSLKHLVPFKLRFREKDEVFFKFIKRVGWIHYLGMAPPIIMPMIFFMSWIIALFYI
jgi:hypothetical protein